LKKNLQNIIKKLRSLLKMIGNKKLFREYKINNLFKKRIWNFKNIFLIDLNWNYRMIWKIRKKMKFKIIKIKKKMRILNKKTL
jgi:hypothetical protein